jgi:hypothetical protein
VYELDKLLAETLDATSLKNAARNAGLPECAFFTIRKVAGVRDYTGTGANPAEPPVRFCPGRSCPAKVGEDDVGLELVGQLSAEHHVCSLPDDVNTRDQVQTFGEQLRYAGMLVDNQYGNFVVLLHETRIAVAPRQT